jgi:hypothetical protein
VTCANLINARRLAAWEAAGKKKADRPKLLLVTFIPEAMGPDGNPRSAIEMSYDLELSNTGKALSPAERGANMLRLRNMGESDAEIARRLGYKDTRWINDLCKLARADKRLRALVKAGIITPTHAVLLPRSHGDELGTDIAVEAGKIAQAKGKGSATGKDIAEAEIKLTGKAPVGNKGKKAANVPARRGTKVTVSPGKVSKDGTTSATINGPFHLGKDLDDATMFDASNEVLCEWPDLATAQAMLLINNAGWHALHKAEVPTVAPGPVSQATPPVSVAPAAPDADTVANAAKVQAATAKATREAARQARVDAQMVKVAAEREAQQAAAHAAALAMGQSKGKRGVRRSRGH